MHESERVFNIGDGSRLMVAWPDEVDGFPALRFGNVRTTALPQVFAYTQGSTRDLDLAVDEGLVDVTHLVFLPDGVIGGEFTQLGPRVTQLPYYLLEMLPDLDPPVVAKSLLQPDTFARLRDLEEVTLAEITVTRSALDIDQEATRLNEVRGGSIFDAFRLSQDQFGGDRVSITIRNTGRAGTRARPLRRDGANRVRELAQLPGFLDAADTFRVRGYSADDPGLVRLDLLNEKIVSAVTVARVGRNRVVSSQSMVREIIRAYGERAEEIGLAGEALFDASA